MADQPLQPLGNAALRLRLGSSDHRQHRLLGGLASPSAAERERRRPRCEAMAKPVGSSRQRLRDPSPALAAARPQAPVTAGTRGVRTRRQRSRLVPLGGSQRGLGRRAGRRQTTDRGPMPPGECRRDGRVRRERPGPPTRSGRIRPPHSTGCFQRGMPSLESPVSRSSSSRAWCCVPGTMAWTVSRPLAPYSNVTSTGQPLGSPAGRSRTTVRPMAMHSPGSELSPSSTLMTIDRWPSDLVAKRSVCRGRQGRVAGNEHHVLLAERVGVDAFDAQAVGVDVGHLEGRCSPLPGPLAASRWPA